MLQLIQVSVEAWMWRAWWLKMPHILMVPCVSRHTHTHTHVVSIHVLVVAVIDRVNYMRDLCEDQWAEVVWTALASQRPVDRCDLQMLLFKSSQPSKPISRDQFNTSDDHSRHKSVGINNNISVNVTMLASWLVLLYQGVLKTCSEAWTIQTKEKKSLFLIKMSSLKQFIALFNWEITLCKNKVKKQPRAANQKYKKKQTRKW